MTAISARVVPLHPQPTGPGPERAAVPACTVPVSDQACFVMFDLPATAPTARDGARLDGTLDGAALPRPMISTALPLRSGLVRHVVLLRRSARAVAGGRLSLDLGGVRVAFIDPAWLQSPLREMADLVDGVAPQGRQRLLRLALTSAPSLLGRSQGHGVCQTARSLLALLDVPSAPLASRCPVGTAGQLLSFRLPHPLSDTPSALIAMAGTRIERLAAPQALLEDGRVLHVFVPGPADTMADFVVLGALPVLLTQRPEAPAPQPIALWLDRRPEPTRAWAEDLLRSHADHDPVAAAILRERALGQAHRPTLALHCLATTRGGLVVWLDIEDPQRLATALRVERASSHVDLAIPASGQVRAHVALPPAQAGSQTCRLRLVHGSGHVRTIHEAVPERFGGSLPPGIPTEAQAMAGHALAAVWADRWTPALAPAVEDFAPQQSTPRLSLVMPLGASPDLVRARAALVACEAAGQGVELVYTLDGHASTLARRLLADTAQTYGIAHRLVALPAATAASDRLIAALGAARAGQVLLLGADVLPEAPGWLARWLGMLDRQSGAAMIGGTLIGVDGAIEHAGGQLDRGAPGEPVRPLPLGRGFPVSDLGDAPTAETGMVSADAVGLTAGAKALVIAAGAASPDPDALLHLALCRGGTALTALRHRFVRFGPPSAADPVVVSAGHWQIAACPDAAAGEERA